LSIKEGRWKMLSEVKSGLAVENIKRISESGKESKAPEELNIYRAITE
jgi:hypothetical protein